MIEAGLAHATPVFILPPAGQRNERDAVGT